MRTSGTVVEHSHAESASTTSVLHALIGFARERWDNACAGLSMLGLFFWQAARSKGRQRTLRSLLAAHLLVLLAITVIGLLRSTSNLLALLGHASLLLGIVEGALVVGWRLVQWPKSRALEPLLLANISTQWVMAGEQIVGIASLAMLSASGIPIFLFLAGAGWIDPRGVVMLPSIGCVWGAVVGFGLVWWAYEPVWIRKIGEKVLGGILLVYFVVGGLFGEHTLKILRDMPLGMGEYLAAFFGWTYRHHPFALVHRCGTGDDAQAWASTLYVTLAAIGLVGLFLVRSAYRLKAHYIERHYRPVDEQTKRSLREIGDAPLSWWAVKRVSEYAGRVNLYLAGGAAVAYSAYLVLGNVWPQWLGKGIFVVFDQAGGVAALTTILVLLAAVPAAYQYGLWDSSVSDRRRRLEEFLTTDLNAIDFLEASWAASWSRGKGYFHAAWVLWMAGMIAGRVDALQVAMSAVAGLTLVLFYFAVGFRCLSRSGEGTTVGFVLSVVLPLGVWGMGSMGWGNLATLLPPGVVYYAMSDTMSLPAMGGVVLAWLGVTASLLWYSRRVFDIELRRWYEASLRFA